MSKIDNGERQSKHCYEGTDVLKNNFDIHDEGELAKKEASICGNKIVLLNYAFNGHNPIDRLVELKDLYASIKTNDKDFLDEKQQVYKTIAEIVDLYNNHKYNNLTTLCKLNKIILGELYPFAGKLRDENTSKGNMTYCFCEYIKDELEREFKRINSFISTTHSADEISEFLGETYGNLHAIHPFREGNTRTLKIYVKILLSRINKNNIKEGLPYYSINYTNVSDEEMKMAIMTSDLSANDSLLKNSFATCLEEHELEQKRTHTY